MRLSITLIDHVILLKLIKFLEILVPLCLVSSFDLHDLFFELFSPFLLLLDHDEFLLGFSLEFLDLLLEAGLHFDVILLLPPQHVDLIF